MVEFRPPFPFYPFAFIPCADRYINFLLSNNAAALSSLRMKWAFSPPPPSKKAERLEEEDSFNIVQRLGCPGGDIGR